MTENKEKTSVLFVCMGNICRSPTAEGVFRKMVADAGLSAAIEIDSAGTHAYHLAEPPDGRAQVAAEKRGYSLKGIKARRVVDADYQRFDLLLVMDDENRQVLLERADAAHHSKIRLFLDYAGDDRREVPDPYYGGSAGFEQVLDLVEAAARGLLAELQRKTGSGNV